MPCFSAPRGPLLYAARPVPGATLCQAGRARRGAARQPGPLTKVCRPLGPHNAHLVHKGAFQQPWNPGPWAILDSQPSRALLTRTTKGIPPSSLHLAASCCPGYLPKLTAGPHPTHIWALTGSSSETHSLTSQHKGAAQALGITAPFHLHVGPCLELPIHFLTISLRKAHEGRNLDVLFSAAVPVPKTWEALCLLNEWINE